MEHQAVACNLEFSVGGLVREGRHAGTGGREATLNWMVNVVRQEGGSEAMTALARRCMDRFLASLDEQESLSAWSGSPLLAASCLLVTSKIFSQAAAPLTARSLLRYAGNDFVMQELLVRAAPIEIGNHRKRVAGAGSGHCCTMREKVRWM
jgi:hypothetical protein